MYSKINHNLPPLLAILFREDFIKMSVCIQICLHSADNPSFDVYTIHPAMLDNRDYFRRDEFQNFILSYNREWALFNKIFY